jgi:nucleotide-binding universal stress UspA family protein
VSHNIHFTSALEDFRLARRRAALQSILGRMRGRREELLSYEDVRRQLRAVERSDRELHDIQVDSIVGSVNRYTDFTRNFLPKKPISAERWARVKAAAQEMAGLPPIEVYQIGDVYFVQDGNHRVSIARQDGVKRIQAYVIRVHTKIPITPDISPDDLIIKAEYLDFMEKTHISDLFPGIDLTTTSPGRYAVILQQIESVKFGIEIKRNKEIQYKDALIYWYDRYYLPIVHIIRERRLLEAFNNRTETDLFIWLVKYQSELQQEIGWEINIDNAAEILGTSASPKFLRWLIKIKGIFIPETLKSTVPIGKWRQSHLASNQGRLFSNIMVVLAGSEPDYHVLDFALNIAEHEGSRIFGFHVKSSREYSNQDKIDAIQTIFDDHCRKYKVEGDLVFESSRNSNRNILNRAHWADLIILPMDFPKGFRRERLFNLLIYQCPTPIFALPANVKPSIKKVLLAFDGSPKSEEALFLAAYLVKFWEVTLVVLTVFGNKEIPVQSVANAGNYLARYNIEAEYVRASGPPSTAATIFASENSCDLIISGGYGHKQLKKMLFGSFIDMLLRETQHSMLICK